MQSELRPLIVTVVAVYVAVHLAIAVLSHVALGHWSDLHFQLKFGALLVFLIVLPLCLLRGQWWTRWAVLCVLLLGFAVSIIEMVQRRAEYSALGLTIQLLHSVPNFVMVLCLFHPTVTGWFRGNVTNCGEGEKLPTRQP
jgi:hypothetical protein